MAEDERGEFAVRRRRCGAGALRPQASGRRPRGLAEHAPGGPAALGGGCPGGSHRPGARRGCGPVARLVGADQGDAERPLARGTAGPPDEPGRPAGRRPGAGSSQVLRLHQQLYGRVPVAERPTYLQTVADQEDAAVRGLAVSWSLELLPAADAAVQQQLAQLLLHLSQDEALEVQRTAVLGLGRPRQPAVFPRFRSLLTQGRPPVHAGRGPLPGGAGTRGRRGDGRAPVQGRGAVAAHPRRPCPGRGDRGGGRPGRFGCAGSRPGPDGVAAPLVRARAAWRPRKLLERIAEPAVLDCLLDALNDPAGTVRFSLVERWPAPRVRAGP